MDKRPLSSTYDVVIIGGAIMGSSTAWFLSDNKDFGGKVLVVEKDSNYEFCSTAHTNSCIRQQFSNELNVRISQFAADFIHNLKDYMAGEDWVPELRIQNFGYLYLAQDAAFAEVLRDNQQVQRAAGAETELLSASEIKARYPFCAVDDILLGSINRRDEGYWEGSAVFDSFRRQARARGVEYIENEVVAITRSPDGSKVDSVTLATGEVVACGQVVNATGPRGARTAALAGLEIPVEPRKRFTWIFSAERPLDQDLPLTIDPSGVHVRENGGGTYLAGGHSEVDPAVDFDDFHMDHSLWETHIWPVLAQRIPQFEAIKVTHEWAGHYAYNTLDHNAILGPHTEVSNFIFLNGFSGHGLQQSPAMGRGAAELITYGAFQTLDLTPFGYERVARSQPIVERAVI